VNNCDTTDAVTLTIRVDTPSVAATALQGTSPVCSGNSVTLTTQGGSLGSRAHWVLYANSVTPANRVDSNFTGVFTVTPSTTTRYLVRAEPATFLTPVSVCPPTDTVGFTVVVPTALTAPTSLNAVPNTICQSGTTTITVVGGNLGNAGQWFLYLSSTATPPLDSNTTGTFAGVNVTGASTYLVRAASLCDTTAAVSVNITSVDSSASPVSLSGDSLVCAGTTATLTRTGGTLGNPPGSRWYLYAGDPTSGGVYVADNLTGTFSVTVNTTTTYYIRAEDPAPCSRVTHTASFTVVADDSCVCSTAPGFVEYAPTSTITLATVECLDTTGWTYYATTAEPDKYLFAIEKQPAVNNTPFPGANTNPFTAEVEITVMANPTNPSSVLYAEDILNCEANFVMPRYWNVHISGSLNGFVRTRFFYPPAELTATITRATNWLTGQALNTACAGATVGPPMVFKTTDPTPADFVPNENFPTGGLVNSPSDIQPTTINNLVYIGYLMNSVMPPVLVNTIQGKTYVEAAWPGFSGGGISVRVSPDTSVLPVTLLYFTGSLVGDKVLLNWETASELNNDFFAVEKSLDGRTWSTIGIVKGNGTTTKPHKYSFVDVSPFIGDNYYRLRQVDFDGSFDYSRIIVINVGTDVARSGFIGVYPNPTGGPVRASIASIADQNIFIRVMDVTGRQMMSKNANLGKGINNIDMDLSRLPGGAYIISFTDNKGEEHSVKLMKQ
jgi:hypothetical protein